MSYIEQTLGFSFMQLAYESFSTDVYQSNISLTSDYAFSQLAYESFSQDVKQGIVPLTANYAFSQLAYESYAKDVKFTYLDYPFALNELYVKASYNPILFAFLGKAWLFDGNNLIDFGSPVKVIFPLIATDGSKIVAGGGMLEDGSVSGDVYGFGIDMYYLMADRDYLAVVVPTDVVYLIDSSGNVVTSTKQLSVVPFMKGWRLASRRYFYAVVMRLL